jgi:PAS domain-containing protein
VRRSGSGAARAGRPDSSRVAASSVDLGPQQRARQAARAAEQLSRVVVEGLDEGVVVIDAQRRAVSWNASALRILELSAAGLAGAVAPFKDDLEIVAEHDGRTLTPGESLSAIAQLEGRPIAGTSTRVDGDGNPQWLRVHARPLSAGGGAGRRSDVGEGEDDAGAPSS